jgi:hypothetical protein
LDLERDCASVLVVKHTLIFPMFDVNGKSLLGERRDVFSYYLLYYSYAFSF